MFGGGADLFGEKDDDQEEDEDEGSEVKVQPKKSTSAGETRSVIQHVIIM